jgi:hypothetical protein
MPVIMLRLMMFLYDAARFFALFILFVALEPQVNPVDNYFADKLLYAAPLSLFPLMAFFLWLDYKKYSAFLYLYAAGKVISICAAAFSIISSFKELFAILLFAGAKKIIINIMVPVLTFIDLLFVILLIFSPDHINSWRRKYVGIDNS